MQALSELPFIGGDPALDFVNTAEERGHPEAGDVLTSPADLRVWGQRYGLIRRSDRAGAADRSEFAQAVDAREVLYALFLARVEGRPMPTPALERLAQLAAGAYEAAWLEPTEDGSVRWRWSPSQLATIRHVAVASALALLTTASSSRLKQCPGEHCGWFFLDTTKRGNRRWCAMRECGQDAKNLRRRRVITG